ncbi:hypothetical protein GOP47_0007880 [Adiantum capillus-veneris]|uniref:3'-5' exonuclease domain-containing protein n=1 Tax=Adiantum capillus-veneris TaxID=13818 RepID=A0A9D4ZLY1_ADICA|nr:hypothetical protein GOP47_0007880 [Adiantum capillus-veneris]
MGGKCGNDDNAVRRKKKRRRTEGASTCATPCQTSTARKQVDTFKPLLGSARAGLGKKKRRLKGSQIEQDPYDLSGEVSSEEEKQSLLAWVEKGMQPKDDGNSMKDSMGISKPGQPVKGSAGRYSNGHAHMHSNGEPSQNDLCDFIKGTKSCAPGGHDGHSEKGLATPDQCAGNEVSEMQGERWHAHSSKSSNINILSNKGSADLNGSDSLSHKNKRKREVDKVLDYVVKRCVMVKTLSGGTIAKPRTTKTDVIAWGRSIPVTLTSEACVVEEWISSHNGDLYGLDVEWRPNRLQGQRNKVALLQLSNEDECLIIQMLFLDRQPQALRKLLSDPSKGLAGVGVCADGKRLLQDYGLEFQGGIELTTLAVEQLRREELRNVGLKVLVQEVLGLALEKPKRVTLSNWAKEKLDQVQINYACLDAWVSFALSKKLLVQT